MSFKGSFEITKHQYRAFGKNYHSHGPSEMIQMKSSSPFEVAFNQISSNDLFVGPVRIIRTPEIFLKVALLEVLPKLFYVNLLEG